MKRRWIIRSIFMVPLLLCIVGWGWSANHGGRIAYCYGNKAITYGTEWGCFEIGYMLRSPSDGWHCGASELAPHFLPPHSILGFVSSSYAVMDWHVMLLPYWFLILVFSSVLFFVWCKTQTKPKGGAFPVEVASKP